MFKKFETHSDKSLHFIESYYNNSSNRKLFEIGRISQINLYRAFVKDLNLRISFNEFKKIYCSIFTLNNNVAKLIAKLKKKYRMVLLSNTDSLHFECIKSKFKIIGSFDEYVLSYKAGFAKPNPLIYLNAIKKSKTTPFNCVYIDDIPEFVYAARLMGIKAFQYKNFKKLKKDLKRAKVL